MLAWKLHGAQNRRQRQRPALRLRLKLDRPRLRDLPGLPALTGLRPVRGLPPHLPNLLAYLHAHRPSKAIGKSNWQKQLAKNKSQKQKAWPSAMPSPLVANLCSAQISAFCLQPIQTQSRLNRSSMAGARNHVTPDIHQQDSSYREA
jgi:hypothetical protein